jgi:hypothetical protein
MDCIVQVLALELLTFGLLTWKKTDFSSRSDYLVSLVCRHDEISLKSIRELLANLVEDGKERRRVSTPTLFWFS